MSRRERHALLLLLVLATVGHAVRLVAGRPDRAAGGVTLLSEYPGDDVGRQRARSLELSRPVGRADPIDLNRATAEDLIRLPGVGPALAKRIVAARGADGPFASLADLDRVPGVGPALLQRIDSVVTLGDTVRARVARAARAAAVARAAPPPPAPTGPTIRVENLPVLPAQDGASGRRIAPALDLNRASLSELLGLRGIGPARARAIVAYRQSHGPFASVGDLEKVPGVGPGLVRQLASQVTVR
jgi:competence ComEA-like helix-hairpin-helix protein